MGTNIEQDHEYQTTTDWARGEIAGNYADAESVGNRLRMAAERCRLIGGATMGPLPLGHEVQLIVVPITDETTYSVGGGKRGFDKSIITTVANAVGVTWTAIDRIDDNSDPNYCHMRVFGEYRQNDGQLRRIVDDRDCDYRDGSEQIRNKSDGEVRAMRMNIMRRAITGAKLRACRDAFGMQHGCAGEDMDRPFVVCKVVFTGRSSDPAVQRMFAGYIGAAYAGASAALFGAAQQAPAQLATSIQPHALLPASATTGIDDGYDDPYPSEVEDYDHETGEIVDDPPPSPPRQQTQKASPPPPLQQKPAPPPRKTQPSQGGREHTIPFGNSQGTPVSQADDRDLEWCARTIAKRLEDGKVPDKYRPENESLLEAMRAEMRRRQGIEPDPNEPGYDDDRRRY